MKEQEEKQAADSFDKALADEVIERLSEDVDKLLEFIAEMSVSCSETKCREKAIKCMGYGQYITYLIKGGWYDYLTKEDWEYVLNKINKED